MTDTTLGAALPAIYSAMGTALAAEIKTNGKLVGLATLTRGNIGTLQPPLPAIYYYGGLMQPPEPIGPAKEHWTLPVFIVAVSRSDTPGPGETAANTYAANARATILATKKLGLTYVTIIESDRFMPAQPYPQDRSLFGAVAGLEIKFTATR